VSPVDCKRAIDLARERLSAQGDDMLKEYVFDLSGGCLVEAEPSSRASAIDEAMKDVSSDITNIIMSPTPGIRTRRTNKLFMRLAAYTSGSANPAYVKNGSANSVLSDGKVTDAMPVETQRAILQAFEPLFCELNPNKFTLSVPALVNTGHYDEAAARAVLLPPTVGSQ
jgi:hypothetical protein